jgi:Xaa-Pro aminopeptidase
MTDFAQRLMRFRADLAASEFEAALVSGGANIRYLSGFTGDYGALLIDGANAILLSDFRYRYQAAEQAPGFQFREVRRWVEGIADAVRELGYRTVGFEPNHITYQVHSQLVAELPEVLLIPADGAIERLRAVKDAQELAYIERAAALTDAAAERVISLVRPGVTERELALAAEDCIRNEGGAELAFPPIVASGPRSAQCHAEPGPRELGRGDLVVIDVGARCEGYGADITRTVAVGTATAMQRDLYALCWRAQAAGLAAVKGGIRCRDLDHAARSVIEDAGRGSQFGHGLGHGVGLEPHEAPRLTSMEEAIVDAGMTMTIEPGIYTIEAGGVRLEDLVVVTESGHRVLTHAPKPAELPVLG